MKLKRIQEEINRLEIYKRDDSITENGEELLKELKYLKELASNTDIIGGVSKRPDSNKIDSTDFVEVKPDECGNHIG